jgi:hypothetical protein
MSYKVVILPFAFAFAFGFLVLGCGEGGGAFKLGIDSGDPSDASTSSDADTSDSSSDSMDAASDAGDASDSGMTATCAITGYQACDAGTSATICFDDEGGVGCDPSSSYTSCKNALGNPPYNSGIFFTCQSQADCLKEGNSSTVYCCVETTSYAPGCPGTFAPRNFAMCYDLYSGFEGSCAAHLGTGVVQACKSDAECNEGDGGHCAPAVASNLPGAAGVIFGVCEP